MQLTASAFLLFALLPAFGFAAPAASSAPAKAAASKASASVSAKASVAKASAATAASAAASAVSSAAASAAANGTASGSTASSGASGNTQTPSDTQVANAVNSWMNDTAKVTKFLNTAASLSGDDFTKQATIALNAEKDELNHKKVLDDALGMMASVQAANDVLANQGTFQKVVDALQTMVDQGPDTAQAMVDAINANRCVNVLPNIDMYFAAAGSANVMSARPTGCLEVDGANASPAANANANTGNATSNSNASGADAAAAAAVTSAPAASAASAASSAASSSATSGASGAKAATTAKAAATGAAKGAASKAAAAAKATSSAAK